MTCLTILFHYRDSLRKSMSTERTFRNLSSWDALSEKCNYMAHCLSEDLAKEHLEMKTLTLKLKTDTFKLRTRSHTYPKYIFSYEDIFQAALVLLKAEMPLKLRLMGLRASCLQKRKLPGKNDEDAQMR